ncbi:uncharacterized protein LOC134190628 [Corticium candelabrum]|uniref:uncharacterized protein LOC134190628 n=1 Tax=Corticium candelabrum TaxID=121492 RepID=UPI002E25B27B|nr:uncharacterized protein LOC134190628 [Corticium candelabrum]
MKQTALLIILWSSVFVRTVSCDGCGVLTDRRELSLSFSPRHSHDQVRNITVYCNSTRNGTQQKLEVVMNASSLLSVPKPTASLIIFHVMFSHPVTIIDSSSSYKVGNPREYIFTLSLASEQLQARFSIVVNGSTVSVSNASVKVQSSIMSGESVDDLATMTVVNITMTRATAITTTMVMSTNPSSSSKGDDSNSNNVLYIVGLAVTSTIAVVSIIVCIILCLKLRRSSRTHHYVEPLPVDLQAIRLPAKLPTKRAMSDPELLGAKARSSFAYDYAFVDGPPVMTVPRRNSDLDFGPGISSLLRHERIHKQQLTRTRSSSEPFLYPPGLTLDRSKQIKPRPPPKPQLSALRKMMSADEIHDRAMYDDPSSPTVRSPAHGHRKAGKPIPSPRFKKKEVTKTKSTGSTATDGYLRPVISDFRQKTSVSTVNSNSSNHDNSLYVPMEIDRPVVYTDGENGECYVPMQSQTSYSDHSQSKALQPSSVRDSDSYENVEEWLDNTKNA